MGIVTMRQIVLAAIVAAAVVHAGPIRIPGVSETPVSNLTALGCPDLPPYRTDHVQNAFDPSKLTGVWYEQAYIDIAQVGASCPIFNNTYDSSSKVLDMSLSVKYLGGLPFTILERYTPTSTDPSQRGLYNKNAAMPGGQLLTLATVFVDATPHTGSTYETVTIYSCVVGVRELVIAS